MATSGKTMRPGEGPKWTRNQQAVLDALREADHPRTAYELLDALRGHGFRAPLQVYRALDRLVEAGVVHRLESLNAFVACHHDHHHASETVAFTICERCNSVAELHDEDMAAKLSSLCAGTGFRPIKTTLEIRGLCVRCQALCAD